MPLWRCWNARRADRRGRPDNRAGPAGIRAGNGVRAIHDIDEGVVSALTSRPSGRGRRNESSAHMDDSDSRFQFGELENAMESSACSGISIDPDGVSAYAETMSREPRAESREPRAESREPRAESREPRAESREPRAESREPRAESREPRAESREPRAESREPRAESREPRAESREPRAESREPRAESSVHGEARRLDHPRPHGRTPSEATPTFPPPPRRRRLHVPVRVPAGRGAPCPG